MPGWIKKGGWRHLWGLGFLCAAGLLFVTASWAQSETGHEPLPKTGEEPAGQMVRERPSPGLQREPYKLTLQEYILRSRRRHARFQELLAERAALKFYKTINTADRDFFLELGSSYGLNLLQSGTLTGASSASGLEAFVSLKKIFLETGTQVSAGYSVDALPSYAGSGELYSFEAMVIQPVLNNAFGVQDRLDDQIAEVEAELASYQVVEAYEDFLSVVIKGYFQWYSNYARLQTARATHRDNLKILKEMYARRRRNIALPVDVNKIELKALKSRFDLRRIEEQYRESYEHIQNFLGEFETGAGSGGSSQESSQKLFPGVSQETSREEALEGGGQTEGAPGDGGRGESAPSLLGVELVPVLPEDFVQRPDSLDEALQEVRLKSRSFSMFRLLEQKAGLDLDKYTDDLLPSAHLFVSYSVQSDDPLLGANNRHDIFLGFGVSHPLGNSVAGAKKERAAIFLKKSRFATRSRAGQLQADLTSLYLRLKTLDELLAINQKQLKVALAILRDEKTYFQRGRISLNDLIIATAEVEQIRFRMDDLKVERSIVYVEWLRLSDALVTGLQASGM